MNYTMPCGEPADLPQIKGHEHVKRALEVCMAGGHSLILLGAPGSGKTMLARALRGLLPALSEQEAADVLALASLAGLPQEDGAVRPERPCVAPRPEASRAALYGGGRGRVKPGAVSRAHRGLLLLDDLPAFGVKLATLPTILDERVVTVERVMGPLTLPAAFQLVATARPCPCGFCGPAPVRWRRSAATSAGSPRPCASASRCTSRCRGCRMSA